MSCTVVVKLRAVLGAFLSGCLLPAAAEAGRTETQIPRLSFGGEFRQTVEACENGSFSTDPHADSTAWFQRYLRHTDRRPTVELRFSRTCRAL